MASCKFEGGKYKGASEVKAHMRHNDISPERRAIAQKGNKHIDPKKSKYNYSIFGLSYEECAAKYDARIKELDENGNTNKRKDRVTMLSIEIPVPADLPHEKYKDWFKRVADILIKRYTKKNLIEAMVHEDEVHQFRHPETERLVWSRVHGHFLVIPEINGKLNAKQLTLRKNMKSLNREVDDMTRAEFGCAFMDGSKKKSWKTVEQLKQESEYAELFFQMDKEEKELEARRIALQVHQAALDERDSELQVKEKKAVEMREKALEMRQEAEKQGEELKEKLQALDDVLKECDGLKAVYKQAVTQADSVADGFSKHTVQQNLGKILNEKLETVFSKMKFKDGSTAWDRSKESVENDIRTAVEAVLNWSTEAGLKEIKKDVRKKESSTGAAVRNLAARRLPLDEATLAAWAGGYPTDGTQMGM